MTNRPNAALRAANATLRRTAAAFGLLDARFHLAVTDTSKGSIELRLTYFPTDGSAPFGQREDLQAWSLNNVALFRRTREATDRMVLNAALAFRLAEVPVPTRWSIHPVAASIVAAAGGPLANPADPLTWFHRNCRAIELPDGDHVVNAVLTGREGVLLLQGATIVDANGDIVATVRMVGPKMLVTIPGAYPDTFASALAGRTAGSLCAVFAADTRGAETSIRSARNYSGGHPCLIVELEDRLVPLLPSELGGERWRPRAARSVVGSRDGDPSTHWLRHSSSLVSSYYASVRTLKRPAASTGQSATLAPGAGPVKINQPNSALARGARPAR